jgi:hypothetical protein
MTISNEIIHFYKRIQNDPYHRYLSWEHCNIHFAQKNNFDIDYSALQLAFYLASWGMYRGSSFLLWKDYKIHTKLIKNLIPKFNKLHNIDFSDKNNDKSNAQLILKASNEIKNYYREAVNSVNGKDKCIEASDTLSTKILLGIFGCIPAYDKYFIGGLKVNKLKYYSINEKSICSLFNFYRTNEDEFEIANNYIFNSSGIYYPKMKLVDMYFWEIGRKKDEKDTKAKKKKKKSI